MWRYIGSNTLTFAGVALFLVGCLIVGGKEQYRVSGPLSQGICFQVASGATFREVSRDLAERGAISSQQVFYLGVTYSGKRDRLKAGSYLLSPGVSMDGIVNQVTQGGAPSCGHEIVYRVGVTRLRIQVRKTDPGERRFVELVDFNPSTHPVPSVYNEVMAQTDTRFRLLIAEGATNGQVITALHHVDILTGNPEEGRLPREGMLAPGNYELSAGMERRELVREMLKRQLRHLAHAWVNRMPNIPLDSPLELLTLASIIEKETGVPEERALVASVFVNRLNQGMRLQTDPTVIYGITRGQYSLNRGLRRSELDRETPWNTYLVPGLPPTPIANPGVESLEAASRPGVSDFLYFVADGKGGHLFATTLSEHNRNVRQWRKIERERATDARDK